MNALPGHWYAVASSRELGRSPLAKTRFGEQLVFWRDSEGRPVCMPDRCPHRGAALSLGKIRNNAIACPFHGFEFAADGHCQRIPAEGSRPVPEGFCVGTYELTESGGYIWLWRGPQTTNKPSPPAHSYTEGRRFAEHVGIWNAHYTRCIENVIDHSHLPFVHTMTIGNFYGDPETRLHIETVDGGFRAWPEEPDPDELHFEFLYPNLWLLRVAKFLVLTVAFAPLDDTHTEVYGRTWYGSKLPGLGPLMYVYNRFSQYMVFREDWPIVASQQPGNVDDADNDKLFPSDAGLIAYRKMRKAHQTAACGISDEEKAQQEA